MNHSSDNYNPKVLTCLANLSNDEVFTPPNLVNDMLDLLPRELWSTGSLRFGGSVTDQFWCKVLEIQETDQ